MKINEIFFSIQGEGIWMGIPTVFIRTTGCNLRCAWCDTQYAFSEGKEMSVEQLIRAVEKYPTKHVCVTGGEPLLQKETTAIINKLLDRGYNMCVETNGSVSIRELSCTEDLLTCLDIKCPSSGMHQKMDFSNIELLGSNDQLKFIIADETDYEYAKEIIGKHSPVCNIIFTPVDGTNLKSLVEKVLKDGLEVRVLPQLHKIIWGNERRGV
ncbi:MAG: radical SAM protein [Thermoplasmata archaeon]